MRNIDKNLGCITIVFRLIECLWVLVRFLHTSQQCLVIVM